MLIIIYCETLTESDHDVVVIYSLLHYNNVNIGELVVLSMYCCFVFPLNLLSSLASFLLVVAVVVVVVLVE